MSSVQVLVYGSLRQGMGNDIHRFAQNCSAKMVKKGTTTSKGLMRSLGGFPAISFPTAKLSEHNSVGEAYEIGSSTEEMMAALERLEGYPTFSDRKEIETEFGPAWVYFFHEDRENLPPVEDGDWVKYREDKQTYAKAYK